MPQIFAKVKPHTKDQKYFFKKLSPRRVFFFTYIMIFYKCRLGRYLFCTRVYVGQKITKNDQSTYVCSFFGHNIGSINSSYAFLNYKVVQQSYKVCSIYLNYKKTQHAFPFNQANNAAYSARYRRNQTHRPFVTSSTNLNNLDTCGGMTPSPANSPFNSNYDLTEQKDVKLDLKVILIMNDFQMKYDFILVLNAYT